MKGRQAIGRRPAIDAGAPSRPRSLPGATGPRGVARRLRDPAVDFHWPIALVMAAACVVASYPGRLNQDSLDAVITTTAVGARGNWHSPTLAWLWGLPGPILGQPAGALLMQAILFGLYAGFLPRLPATARGRLTLGGELLLRVALVGAFGFIGKDIVLVGAMLLWIQIARHGVHAGLRWRHHGALAAITVLALSIKAPNFFAFATAFALVFLFLAPSPGRYLGMTIGVLAVGMLAIPLDRAIDRYVFDARDLHPDKQLVIFDLAGIGDATGTDQFAAVPGWPTAGLPPVERCFLPYMWDAFAPWGPCSGYSLAYDRLEAGSKRRWLAAIVAHPGAYARHRLTYSGYLLRSTDHRSWGIGGEAVNDAGSAAGAAEMREMMRRLHANRPVQRWRPTPATPALAWLERHLFGFPRVQSLAVIGSLAILLLCWMRRHDTIRLSAIVPVGLGLGNFLMLVLFGVADPARYLLPTICMFYTAILALAAPDGDGAMAAQGPNQA